MLANTEVALWESLEELEARVDGTCITILRDYRTYLKLTYYRRRQLLPFCSFAADQPTSCPQIAVAS
jgi:hypothetical protein